MPFDISIPLVLFSLTAVSVFLYPKLEKRVRVLLEERKFRMRDAALLVVLMGVSVTVYLFIPAYAITIFFLIFYSLALFIFVYMAVSKWHIALILPAVFLLLYFFFWGIPQIDLFAAIFVVFISVYVGTLFEWKTLAVFAGLVTIMDIIQVFGTRFMVTSSSKMMDLKLPVAIMVPSFPYQNQMIPGIGFMALGLGDFLLSGLLAIQTAKKYGRKFGYISIVFIACVSLIFGAIQLWYFELWFSEFLRQLYPVEKAAAEAAAKAAMPATVFIVCGWLIALGARHIYNSLTTKKTLGEEK